MYSRLVAVGVSLVIAMLSARDASAVKQTFTDVSSTKECDMFSIPFTVDELGSGGLFPDDEQISALPAESHEIQNCGAPPLPGQPTLHITNNTHRTFSEVYYVGGIDTTFSNRDGMTRFFVNAQSADLDVMRIDDAGLNKPLVFQSLPGNLDFEPGETWGFLIADYQNSMGLPQEELIAPGIIVEPPESGSIIAIEREPPPSAVIVGNGRVTDSDVAIAVDCGLPCIIRNATILSPFTFRITDGVSRFVDIRLPSGYGDSDGLYTVTSENGALTVTQGDFVHFDPPVDTFVVTGNDAPAGADGLSGLPMYLVFDQPGADFTMSVPEPSALALVLVMCSALFVIRRCRPVRLPPSGARGGGGVAAVE